MRSGLRGPSTTAEATARRNATSSDAAGTSRASGWSTPSPSVDSNQSVTLRAGIGVGGITAVGRGAGAAMTPGFGARRERITRNAPRSRARIATSASAKRRATRPQLLPAFGA